MLLNLVEHAQFNCQTLLAKIVGVYEVRMQGLRPVNVIVMKNCILKTHEDNKITLKFDIKGSMISRSAFSSQEARTLSQRQLDELSHLRVLKDRDFVNCLRRKNNNLINMS